MTDYIKLKEYCDTPRQAARMDAIIASGGNVGEAAKSLGEKYHATYSTVKLLKRKAAKQGYAPEHDMTHVVPDGYLVKGTSTLYKDGQPVMQWVKSSQDAERQRELLAEAVQAFTDDLPKAEPVIHTGETNDDLLNLYTIADYHLGMFAWDEESGVNWDIHIAEQVFYRAIDEMIERSENASHGFINILGDFLHTDGPEPVTPRSKHPLDQSVRFLYAVRVGIRLIRYALKRALEKHKKVTLLIAEGNHDETSSGVLREMCASFYETEPRLKVSTEEEGVIEVIDDASVFYAYKHGKTLLPFHHGHKVKPERMYSVVTSRFRELWGQTDYCYAHMAHLHSRLKDYQRMVIEQHQTLIPKDSYSSNLGYDAERGATAITYSKKSGEYSRVIVRPRV